MSKKKLKNFVKRDKPRKRPGRHSKSPNKHNKRQQKKKMKLGPEQNVNMPLKTVISLITLVSIFTFSYFQITERLNNLETQDTLMQSDLLRNAQQTPKNLEIFMLLEELFKQTDKQQILLDNNIHTQIKLEHLEDQLEKALRDIEKLKDKVRENGNSYSTNNVSR